MKNGPSRLLFAMSSSPADLSCKDSDDFFGRLGESASGCVRAQLPETKKRT